MKDGFREKFDNFMAVWFVSIITLTVIVALCICIVDCVQKYRLSEKMCEIILQEMNK